MNFYKTVGVTMTSPSDLLSGLTFAKNPLLEKVLSQVVFERHKQPFFLDREIVVRPNVPKSVSGAFLATAEILLQRGGAAECVQQAAADIVAAIAMACGGKPFGDHPYSAPDPVILLDGNDVGLSAGIYGLMAENRATHTTAIPGGFASIHENTLNGFGREACQEVLAGLSDQDLMLKLVLGDSSAPGRAIDRYLDLHLQVISAIGLLVTPKGMRITPRVEDTHENSGFKLVKLYGAGGKPLWKQILNEIWRDDHLTIITRIMHWWSAFSQANGIKRSLLEFLRELPTQTSIESPYAPTPESNPPRTFNVALAEEVIAETLVAHNFPDAARVAEVVNAKLGPGAGNLNYRPLYVGPLPVVDVALVGIGDHENDIIVTEDPETGLMKIPGRMVRFDESIAQAAERAVLEKLNLNATPWMLAGLGPEWVLDGGRVVPRDPRYAMTSYIVVAIVTTGRSRKIQPTERYLPFFRRDRSHGTGVSAEILETEWLYHHKMLLQIAARQLLSLGIVRNDNRSLLQSLLSRAPRF